MSPLENYPRYDLEEAAQEASEMKTKILRGEAKDYDEAERQLAEEEYFSNLKCSAELTDTKNIDVVSSWFKNELSEQVDMRDGFMMGYHYEDVIHQMVEFFAKKSNATIKDLDSFPVRSKFSNHYDDEYSEGTTNGTIFFMEKSILYYSSYADGYHMSIDEWDESSLSEAISEMIQAIEQPVE